ncbi:MAG TPA: hypothetical protein VHK45_03690 [Geminicoccaceae bacterium]|jgi:hypothetical protein|nr:hypothetical protein [Geminicoccaceae bacterium]
MSTELDSKLPGTGTRFRLFAQSPTLPGFREPETVWVSSPPGNLRPGPADERMQVIDAIDKPPYDDHSAPPWRGAVQPPAEPDAAGHFDHHPLYSRAFNAAHMFGAIRRVLDIWEGYSGSEIRLMSLLEPIGERLELIPEVKLERNAQTGPGYLETGYVRDADGRAQPLCLNIDVIAHEVGHRIVFAKVGIPFRALTAEFLGFAESASDLIALITAMHFDTVIDNVLRTSSGNFYVLNELNRFAELSDNDQIRIASNSKRMRDVVDAATPADQLTQPELHELGEPLTGALFDIFVDFYQREIVERGAIPADLAEEAWRAPALSLDQERLQTRFDRAFEENGPAFRAAVRAARDALGRRLALTWDQLAPDWLTFREVAIAFLTADRSLTGWRHQDDIAESFAWREIGPPRPPGPARSLSAQEALRFLLRRRLCARSQVEWRHQRRARLHAAPVAPSRSPGSTEGTATPHEHREMI